MKVKPIQDGEGDIYARMFHCPGCKTVHIINVEKHNPIWEYNWNDDAPTFKPSLLVTSGHHCAHWTDTQCYCNWERTNPDCPDEKCFRCHSFITDGNIQFLDDCTHELAGQTVPMLDMPSDDPIK